MLRLTKIERGNVYSGTGIKPYKLTYTQPFHNYFVAELYHDVWERMTQRLYLKIEKLTKRDVRRFFDDSYVPLTCRQDIRCHYLKMKNRITVSTEYGENRPWPEGENPLGRGDLDDTQEG